MNTEGRELRLKSASFLGDTRKQMRDFSDEANAVAGRELYRVQCGEDPSDWKPMTAIGPGYARFVSRNQGNFESFMWQGSLKRSMCSTT